MNRQSIEMLTRSHRLLDRTAFLKPNAPYRVDGGYVIANRDHRAILLAVRGHLDDRIWVEPAHIDSIADATFFEVDGSRLTAVSAAALRDDVAPHDGWLWVSPAVADNLRRFGL